MIPSTSVLIGDRLKQGHKQGEFCVKQGLQSAPFLWIFQPVETLLPVVLVEREKHVSIYPPEAITTAWHHTLNFPID